MHKGIPVHDLQYHGAQCVGMSSQQRAENSRLVCCSMTSVLA